MEELENIKSAIVNPILTLLLAAGVIYFLWGVASFMMHRDDETESNKGKQHMLWGILGLAIIVSAFGIVNLIARFVGEFR